MEDARARARRRRERPQAARAAGRGPAVAINAEHTKLHSPLYWHYDILFALKVMAETGFIADPRCADALDLLEAKELPSGGWGADARYYSVSKAIKLNADFVDWGGTSKKILNPWVTTDALAVLRRAGRWKP